VRKQGEDSRYSRDRDMATKINMVSKIARATTVEGNGLQWKKVYYMFWRVEGES